MSNSSDDSFEDIPSDFLSKVKTDNKYGSANDDHPEENDPETDKAIGAALEDRRKYISRECMEARKSLDFGSSDINDLDCVTISMYLVEKHTNLKILHLGSNHIEDEGLIDILSGLQWHTQLRELYLGNNPFSSLGVNALIDTLPLFEHLEILSLCNIGMDDELAVLFCDAISELNNLNTLFLNTNDIGDDTFLTLSYKSILFSSKKLPIRILHLGETLPTSQGLVPFLKALQTNDTLKHLYLNDIKFDNEAVNSLNKLLMRNEALEQINLGNCNIDDEGVNVLKDGISSNSTLQYLHLWSNKITDEGAQTLLEVLQEDNDALLGLSLFGNQIKHDDIIDEIKELLKQNAGFMQVALREKDLLINGNENRMDGKEDEYEEDFEDDEGDDKENKADEQELEEIEKEIEDTERELFEEKMHRRALKEKEKQLKVKEKVWQGFSKPTGGMMHSSFKEK